MNIFDKLQSVFRIEILPSLKNVKINIGNNNKKFENKGTILIVNSNNLDKKEIEIVKGLLVENVEENGIMLEEESEKLLEEVMSIEKKGANKASLDFFYGKISQIDLEILRASFIIKELHEKHKPVGELKSDIMQRYGKRGSNISNLCTAGYFGSVIKPLYEAMAVASDFTLDQFRERYNVIVGQYPFAVFVSIRMSKEETKQKILQKIKLNKSYGIKQMNVHGIGKNNVIKIQQVLYEIRDEINWPAQIDSGDSFINAKVTF